MTSSEEDVLRQALLVEFQAAKSDRADVLARPLLQGQFVRLNCRCLLIAVAKTFKAAAALGKVASNPFDPIAWFKGVLSLPGPFISGLDALRVDLSATEYALAVAVANGYDGKIDPTSINIYRETLLMLSADNVSWYLRHADANKMAETARTADDGQLAAIVHAAKERLQQILLIKVNSVDGLISSNDHWVEFTAPRLA